jgi:hypothetical protein
MTDPTLPAPDTAVSLAVSGPRILVYSCYFGIYEPFNPKATGDGQGYDRLVVTDQPVSAPGIETLRDLKHVHPDHATATHLSRLAKLRPHLFFADYDWVIYIDNSANLMCNPHQIVVEIEAAHAGLAPAGRYLFEHQRRHCAYREARLCMKKGRIPRADYRRQVQLFQQAGFPMDHGLFVNTMLVQKMGDAATDALNDAWYDHFLTYSQRDQISLPFLLWQMDYPVRLVPRPLFDLAHWPVFKKFRRVKFQSAERARAAKNAIAA